MYTSRQRRPLSIQTRIIATALAGILVTLSTITSVAQEPETQLYVCIEGSDQTSAITGLALCDAEPTENLTDRAEVDNLQVRAGALVSRVETRGTAALGGLAVGDVIYRVGGTDVDDADTAAQQLDLVGTSADTVVNFLRFGRPYRIKLRR